MGQIELICQRFFQNRNDFSILRIKGGHINDTFKITFGNKESYILQSINNSIFKDPEALMHNIQTIADHLKKSNYPLEILTPILSENGLLETDNFGNFWRAFPFFENTTVFEKVTYPDQAFEAAKAFSLFIKHLDGIDLKTIQETTPKFHNLYYRKAVFDRALSENKFDRNEKANSEINKILKWWKILKFDFEKMPLRVVHNDAKISNVLLDKKGEKGVCVVDLDTVMPGYLITDFGDMVRTMCCTASEEEKDIEKVAMDIVIFKATAKGFLSATETILTKEEKENLISGCIYIIFEQAIRFLTDYLVGDKYYQISYANQNLFRAKNQLKLLASIMQNKNTLEKITTEFH